MSLRIFVRFTAAAVIVYTTPQYLLYWNSAMRALLALVMCSVATGSLAQSIHIFKEVHADGTVVYSDTRPVTPGAVEEVKIYQSSAAIEQQGEQRKQEMDAIGKKLEKQRTDVSDAKREYQRRVAEARDEVAAAERALVIAQQSKKAATPERITAAEEQLRMARRRLRDVQSAGP